MRALATGIYRLALLTCPAEFRRLFGRRMLADFADLLSEPRSAVSHLGLAMRESVGVIGSGWRARRDHLLESPLSPAVTRPSGQDRLRLAWDDIAFAARSLWTRPGYAAVSVLTLALGIGASTIVFSVVDKVVIQPLPYEDSERIVFLYADDLKRERANRFPTTAADFMDWQEMSSSFSHIAASRSRSMVLTGGSHLERVRVAEVSDGAFGLIGVNPHLGTTLGPAANADDVVITHGTWQRLFGGDTDVVGRSIELNGQAHTVVGVTPAGFRAPWYSSPAMWRPLRFSAEEAADRSARSLIVLAKLRPDVAESQAEDELEAIAATLAEAYPSTNENWGARIVGAKEIYLENSRSMYLILSAAVALVLLVACVNLASLALARGATRQTEMAIRLALGAGRLRMVRLLLAEGAIVALAGAAVGIGIAIWGLAAILPFAPTWPLVLRETAITARSFAFTVGVALAALLMYGLLPAMRLSRPQLGGVLGGAARAAGGSLRELRLRRALVVGQMALAVVLLVGAGLLIRSVINIINADTGYDYRGVVTARVLMGTSDQGADVYFDQLLARAAGLPGVTSAALVDAAPMDGSADWVRVFIDGERVQQERALGADYRRVSTGYFETMAIEAVAGRLFNLEDEGGQGVAVINEEFASRFLSGRNPLGERVEVAPSMGLDPGDQLREWLIVGVVETVQEWGPTSFEVPMIYVPHTSDPHAAMSLVLRSDASPEALVGPLREIVREIGDSPVDGVRTLATALQGSYETHRFMLALLGSFAVLAAALSAIGLYGVMAYHVIQRQREIGVRVALGAARRDVAGMVLRQGTSMALVAVVLGVAGAIPMARALSTLAMGRLLVDMHWFDPIAFALVPLLVLATAVLASWLPARRAARVDPVEALRAEA